tara:strand:- start:22019 stop:22315 length:297 start_codon:yes stop_codon:yes gene_type:complete
MHNGLRFILMFMVTVICLVYFFVCIRVMIRCCIGLGECVESYKLMPMEMWKKTRERIRKRRRMNVVIIYPVPEALETTEYAVQEAMYSRDVIDAVEVI